MSSLVSFALVTFGSLFSIVDPFAAVPMFLALAGGRPRLARADGLSRVGVLRRPVGLRHRDASIFSFFGITLPAFKIAGGILLFGVGLEMMRAPAQRHADDELEEERDAPRPKKTSASSRSGFRCSPGRAPSPR